MKKMAFVISFALALALAAPQALALTRITDLFINTSVANITDNLCLGGTCSPIWLTYNASYNAQLGHNTTAEIFAAVDNSTFHRFSQQITWANLSSWSLNNVWTGSLGWGNVSARSLDIVWTNGGLGAANITTGILTNARLDSKIHFINNTAQLLTAGNLTTGTINQSHLISSFRINSGNISGTLGNVTGIGTASYIARWFNTTEMNSSAIYQKNNFIGINNTAPLVAFDVIGNMNISSNSTVFFGKSTANITYNGTCTLMYGLTSRIEVC